MVICLLFFVSVLSCSPGSEGDNASTAKKGDWTAYDVVDVHGHIGTFKGYDLSTETLLKNIARFDVRLVLVSNIDGANLPGTTGNLDEEEANLATVSVVRQFPQKLRGLIWARPNDGSPGNVEKFLKDEKYSIDGSMIFVGIKLHPDMNQFPADDQRVDGYLKLCRDYRIPALFHSGESGTNSDPRKIYAVARRFPEVSVVLYHMGFLGPHEGAISVVEESIRDGDAQLYLETAQADPQMVVQAVRELGAERVLFGSDATYYGDKHYEEYRGLIETLKDSLSEEEFELVIRGNAKSLFRIGD